MSKKNLVKVKVIRTTRHASWSLRVFIPFQVADCTSYNLNANYYTRGHALRAAKRVAALFKNAKVEVIEEVRERW